MIVLEYILLYMVVPIEINEKYSKWSPKNFPYRIALYGFVHTLVETNRDECKYYIIRLSKTRCIYIHTSFIMGNKGKKCLDKNSNLYNILFNKGQYAVAWVLF